MLSVTSSHEAGALVCHVVGELDAFTATSFRSETAWLPSRSRAVVIDLSGVGFIDSSGLGALLGLVRRCQEHTCL